MMMDLKFDLQNYSTIRVRLSMSGFSVLQIIFTVSLTKIVIEPAHCAFITEHNVQCDEKEIRVVFRFADPFNGIIYTDDNFTKEHCRCFGNGTKSLTVTIPVNVKPALAPFCGTKFNQVKNEFSVLLVVNDLRDLLVDGLQVFEVQCKFELNEVTISSGVIKINSSILKIQPQSVIKGKANAILPNFLLNVRDSHGISGPKLDSVSLGQEMTLDVVMEEKSIYDFFVHSCYASDGKNSSNSASVMLVDQKGCAMNVHRIVQPPITVTTDNSGYKHVFVNMFGFQFSSKDLIYLECQILPCFYLCNVSQCGVNSYETVSKGLNLSLINDSINYSQSLNSLRLHTKLAIRPSSLSDEDDEDSRNVRVTNVATDRHQNDENKVMVQSFMWIVTATFITAAILIILVIMRFCWIKMKKKKGFFEPPSTPNLEITGLRHVLTWQKTKNNKNNNSQIISQPQSQYD